MSELFQAAVNAAEMAAVGEGGPAGERIAQLLASPADARSGNDEERAYLAVLLDFIGLREESARILQTPLGAGQADTSATLRNMEGMLATAHGDYDRAQQILRAALQAAAGSPALRVKIEANLAAASWGAGALEVAETWIDSASAQHEGRTPASDVLIASVRAQVAAARGDLESLRSASTELGTASRERIGELGADHPQTLAIVANLARTQVLVALAEGSRVRLERAAGVLEVAAIRLAAELGADHPLSLAARNSLPASESGQEVKADPGSEAADQAGSQAATPGAGVTSPLGRPPRLLILPTESPRRVPRRDDFAVPPEPRSTVRAPSGPSRNRRTGPSTVFFFSYAQTGHESDGTAERFYSELRAYIETLVNVPVGTALGFFDQVGIEPATRWDTEWAEALGACQVLVPLVSAPYLGREWCGKEWHAFTQRKAVALAGAGSSLAPTPIVPVLWAPVPFALPAALGKQQFFTPTNTEQQPELVRAYEEDGMFHLLNKADRGVSDMIIWQLAKRIQTIYYSQRLQPRNFQPADLENVFKSGTP